MRKCGRYSQDGQKMAIPRRVVQVLQELDMQNAIFNFNTRGMDDERFTIGMSDNVFQSAPPSLFGSIVAILAQYVGRPINEVTMTVASLGEVETRCTQKAMVAKREGSLKVTRTQM